MWRRVLLTAVVAVASGAMQSGHTMQDLTFLTREGRVNTPDMLVNLDDALIALKWRRNYQYIDIRKLPTTDVRAGYPTPT
jgi:hypothetical protein